ncbi:MAG: hypothetical protein GEU73_02590 [Chloroflexi bacterium]|nr:hypothetical protein [Chloroflexota bacterium]
MNAVDLQVEIMRAAGLEEREIVRLASLRQLVHVGQCSEVTHEYKRLAFLKYLCNTGRLGA